MHFPSRQWSDHCPLSQEVDLVTDRFVGLGTVSPKCCWISLRGGTCPSTRSWKGKESGALCAAPLPSSVRIAVPSVTLYFLKAEL